MPRTEPNAAAQDDCNFGPHKPLCMFPFIVTNTSPEMANIRIGRSVEELWIINQSTIERLVEWIGLILVVVLAVVITRERLK